MREIETRVDRRCLVSPAAEHNRMYASDHIAIIGITTCIRFLAATFRRSVYVEQ